MYATLARKLSAAAAIVMMTAAQASAQWYPGNVCTPCAQAAVPVVTAPPVTVVQACPCLQAVPQTVYREVPVTKYRQVKRTVKKPVVRTVYEDRKVTAYRQVVETKTVNVPTTTYQQVTEYHPQVVDQGRWLTTYHRVPKMSPCQYDPNPTLLGWMNRNAYSLRMAFTPNYYRRRQYMPNLVAYNVPVSRTVAIPGTRQVTYNVARLVPYETTHRVAKLVTEYVDEVVTAYEPYTEMQTVAVGTQYQYAYVNPFPGATATALNPEPTPAKTAKEEPIRKRAAGGSDLDLGTRPSKPSSNQDGPSDLFNPISHPVTPETAPGYFDARNRQEMPESKTVDQAIQVAGWKAYRPRANRDRFPVETAPSESTSVVTIAAKR